MTALTQELEILKSMINDMFQRVISQMDQSKIALANFDKEHAMQILDNEKGINKLELKIDRECENIIALFNPVAIDLRFVIASMKINSNLERIGDIAESIAKFIVLSENKYDEIVIEKLQLMKMFDICNKILVDSYSSFNSEDMVLARNIFMIDKELDEINRNATSILGNHLSENNKNVTENLYILSIIRKLERLGDHVTNISEEIIFSVESRVLKHKKTTKKMKMKNDITD